eukprot:TRINITY_DN1880_c1_g1_i3.p1 TRINITY_DN1880_c1_g1~~TRINITY_DN1880_c1_g1_i3.p1  ORF type:complete len:132 (-),score=0.43 TRINITY_DN1880_c1_g1_i3:685-1080(-)
MYGTSGGLRIGIKGKTRFVCWYAGPPPHSLETKKRRRFSVSYFSLSLFFFFFFLFACSSFIPVTAFASSVSRVLAASILFFKRNQGGRNIIRYLHELISRSVVVYFTFPFYSSSFNSILHCEAPEAYLKAG